ncbi:MAG: hypothetical protein C0501_29695 [Isosphaera sp.]|nr:hypothetical protein [Isosphaera sp.]
MTPPEPTDDRHPIDDLVREHLDREAAGVDAARVLARVRAAPAAPRRRLPRWVGPFALGLGVGAAAAAALVLLTPDPPAPNPVVVVPQSPAPAELVRAAVTVHSDDTDRRYEVKVERGDLAALARRFPHLPPPQYHELVRDSTLWVRGEQFWVDPGPDAKTRAWGRDRDGRVWVALGPRLGVQFAREEAGDPIARLCDQMSLRVPTLAAEMLDGYELSREDGPDGGESVVRIAGVLREPGREYATPRVWLEIDPRTKVIRKAVQKRVVFGEAVGTFTYTLQETAKLPDSLYDVRGHLDPGARVWDARNPQARTDQWNRWPAWKR